MPGGTTNETIRLTPLPQLMPGALLRERTWTNANVAVRTSFYLLQPRGVCICTAPLIRFVQTRITGLSSDPVVLTNYFSQTYDAGRHNWGEEFIFEPRLETGLPQSTLAELNAANVQLLYVQTYERTNATFYVLGLDGMFRALP